MEARTSGRTLRNHVIMVVLLVGILSHGGNTKRIEHTRKNVQTIAACDQVLGLAERRRMADFRFMATSGFGFDARLNHGAAWTPSVFDEEPSLMVELPGLRYISAVRVQGSPREDAWVKSFAIGYSKNCTFGLKLRHDTGQIKVFQGSSDSSTVTTIALTVVPLVKCFQIYPLTNHGRAALRLELLGCEIDKCRYPLWSTQGVMSNQSIILDSLATENRIHNGKIVSHFGQEVLLTGLISRRRQRSDNRRHLNIETSRNCKRYTAAWEEDKIVTTLRDGLLMSTGIQATRTLCLRQDYPTLPHDVSIVLGCKARSKTRKKTICPIRSIRRKRIVSGVQSYAGEWPWMVTLLHNGNISKCAGSLISEEWIMSAAHCFTKLVNGSRVVTEPETWTARLGEHDLSADDLEHQDYKIHEIIPHPNYVSIQSGADIALLRVVPGDTITLTPYVQPICFDTDEDEHFARFSRCYVAGWGSRDYDFNDWSPVLEHIEVNILDHSQCSRNYSLLGTTLPTHTLCAVGNSGADACEGDSGGALACVTASGIWHQVAVVSFGYACGRTGYPGIYTKIGPYKDWIESLMQN